LTFTGVGVGGYVYVDIHWSWGRWVCICWHSLETARKTIKIWSQVSR